MYWAIMSSLRAKPPAATMTFFDLYWYSFSGLLRARTPTTAPFSTTKDSAAVW